MYQALALEVDVEETESWFGSVLLRHMHKHNLTQKEFADFLGVARGTLQNWLNYDQTPNVKKQQLILNKIGVDMTKILPQPNIQAGTPILEVQAHSKHRGGSPVLRDSVAAKEIIFLGKLEAGRVVANTSAVTNFELLEALDRPRGTGEQVYTVRDAHEIHFFRVISRFEYLEKGATILIRDERGHYYVRRLSRKHDPDSTAPRMYGEAIGAEDDIEFSDTMKPYAVIVASLVMK